MLTCKCDEGKPYIFISYSHKDSEEVHKIISKMYENGYNVWFDDGIDPGTEWDENIANHIADCGYFIAFMSNNYIVSDNCKDELNFVRDLNKERILVYVENVKLPNGMAMRLNRLQAINKWCYQDEGDFYNKLFATEKLNQFKNDCVNTDDSREINIPSDIKSGDIIKFGVYPQNREGEDKTPIEWIVLMVENDRALLLSKYILDCRPYDERKQFRDDVTWENCTLRKWLNEQFVLCAFNNKERKLIESTETNNDINPKYGINFGKSTIDKVFLFSISEKEKFLDSEDAGKCVPSEYAREKGCYTKCFDKYYMIDDKLTSQWLLRDACRIVFSVFNDGTLHADGVKDSSGVRPAMWISLKS